MRLGFDLNLEQAQKLIMTPELRQAIQILQFTNQELWEYIDQQMEVNPLLEAESRQKNEENIEDISSKIDEIDWKEYLGKYDDISYKSNNKDNDEKKSIEHFIASSTSLKDHLMFQLGLTIYNKKYLKIGQMIIESINKNGYLDTSIEEISNQLKVSQDETLSVLEIIHTFDPVGIGARDLKECILIQLRMKSIDDEAVYKVVEEHLEDVGHNRVLKISKDLNISVQKSQWICDLIKSLEPKPGRGFAHDGDDIKYITPDVVLEYIDGEYIILVNDVTAPRLNVSSFYRELLNKAEDQNISKFLNDKLNSALWLIKSIEQRRMTLYKVVESIVKFQKEFFDKGKKSLKPLILKEVAEDIGVHESTVSRATNGKYVQTPRGIFELKYFFSSGVESQSGGVSATSVKSIITELINDEDHKKPLSDQQIADLLKKRNIKISRRTVAKYRDELNIPSSSMRRRY